MKPGETTTVALMFRELALTNVTHFILYNGQVSFRGIPKGEAVVKGILDGQEFVIATLSKSIYL